MIAGRRIGSRGALARHLAEPVVGVAGRTLQTVGRGDAVAEDVVTVCLDAGFAHYRSITGIAFGIGRGEHLPRLVIGEAGDCGGAASGRLGPHRRRTGLDRTIAGDPVDLSEDGIGGPGDVAASIAAGGEPAKLVVPVVADVATRVGDLPSLAEGVVFISGDLAERVSDGLDPAIKVVGVTRRFAVRIGDALHRSPAVVDGGGGGIDQIDPGCPGGRRGNDLHRPAGTIVGHHSGGAFGDAASVGLDLDGHQSSGAKIAIGGLRPGGIGLAHQASQRIIVPIARDPDDGDSHKGRQRRAVTGRIGAGIDGLADLPTVGVVDIPGKSALGIDGIGRFAAFGIPAASNTVGSIGGIAGDEGGYGGRIGYANAPGRCKLDGLGHVAPDVVGEGADRACGRDRMAEPFGRVVEEIARPVATARRQRRRLRVDIGQAVIA